MILAGINTYGTQAAEYVTRPEYIRDLISRLNIAEAGGPGAEAAGGLPDPDQGESRRRSPD